MRKMVLLIDKYRQNLKQIIAQPLTGVCCQWRDSASYDSAVLIETYVLRGKFSREIATAQQPPDRYA